MPLQALLLRDTLHMFFEETPLRTDHAKESGLCLSCSISSATRQWLAKIMGEHWMAWEMLGDVGRASRLEIWPMRCSEHSCYWLPVGPGHDGYVNQLVPDKWKAVEVYVPMARGLKDVQMKLYATSCYYVRIYIYICIYIYIYNILYIYTIYDLYGAEVEISSPQRTRLHASPTCTWSNLPKRTAWQAIGRWTKVDEGGMAPCKVPGARWLSPTNEETEKRLELRVFEQYIYICLHDKWYVR